MSEFLFRNIFSSSGLNSIGNQFKNDLGHNQQENQLLTVLLKAQNAFQKSVKGSLGHSSSEL